MISDRRGLSFAGPVRAGAGRDFREALARQEEAGLLRVEQVVGKPDARRVRLADGRLCVDFSSNSYLGLHEKVTGRVLRRFLKDSRLTSAGSSRMVSGTQAIHHELEEALADFAGAEEAAVFGSGFLGCVGVVSTLAGGRDRILYDESIHASLRCGIRLSAAPAESFRHADPDDLGKKLAIRRPAGRTFIVTDGLFSMEGDFAPIDRLSELAARYDAWLIVDDAHGIGAVGPAGRGTYEKFDLFPADRHVLIGTLSKTFASYGGFVTAASPVIRYIKARSREFIYTTAAPPFQVLAALESLRVVRSREGSELRKRLWRNVRLLRRLLPRHAAAVFQSQIIPVPIAGGSPAVLAAARTLWEAGCFAVGMRYPTVPRGREMIRISLSAAHTDQDIRRLAEALR